jgi:Flp pilus assembly pilin Flp
MRARVGAESGQTMAEYATVLGVLIIAVVAAITVFATAVDNKLQSDIVTILSGI